MGRNTRLRSLTSPSSAGMPPISWHQKCTAPDGNVNMFSVAQGPYYRRVIEVGRAGEAFQSQSDRRNSVRIPLQWPLYVNQIGIPRPLRTRTRNLSSHGFYCVLQEPLTAGDHIECDLLIPTHMSRSGEDVLFLRCQARVVRVEQMDAGEGYGLACRIEDYCLVHRTGGEDPGAPFCADSELA